MKVHGQSRTLVVTKKTSDGKFISRKTIAPKGHKNSRIVCAVDPVSVATYVAAAGTAITTAFQVRDYYRSRKAQKRCKFPLVTKQRKCNRPIVDTGYFQKDGKKYRYNICDKNHQTSDYILELRPKE